MRKSTVILLSASVINTHKNEEPCLHRPLPESPHALLCLSVTAVQPDVQPLARLQQVVQGLQEQIWDASQRQVLEELSTDALKTIDFE
jgi:hypothetical protein